MKYLFGILLILALSACGSGGGEESQQQSDSTTETSSQVLHGPDQNGNGVRDDVDEWIDSVSENERESLALTNMARAFEEMYDFNDYGNEAAFVTKSEERGMYQGCVLSAIAGLESETDFSNTTFDQMNRYAELIQELEGRIFNTKERFRKYIEVNNLMGGSMIDLFDRYEECE